MLAVTHRLQAAEDLRAKMKAEYFAVLRDYPVDIVQQAYETLRRRMKKWPVPADWLEAFPPFGSVERLPVATPEQIAMNAEAERLGYEPEEYCRCEICVREEATHLKSRYVPIVVGPDEKVIERRDPHRAGRPILLGRWIHGHELKRWYAARAKFYEMKNTIWADLQLEKNQHPDSRIQRMERLAAGIQAEHEADR